MPGDVLRRNALRTLGERIFVARLFFLSQFALGMSVEIRAIAAQREHEQQLGIQARRGNVGGIQALDGTGKSLTETHKLILSRRTTYDGLHRHCGASFQSLVPKMLP